MSECYKHLNDHERKLIYNWFHIKKDSCRTIAKRLSRHHTTISREIKRNINKSHVPTYHGNVAHHMAKIRLMRRSQRYLLKDENTRAYVIERLKLGWSPDIISGRLKHKSYLQNVSHESIYQFIYKTQPSLIQFLARKHKKRKRKFSYRSTTKIVKNKVLITDRPKGIDLRKQVGHWESDSIECSKSGGLNVIVERVTRFVHISKIPTKHACYTKDVIVNSLQRHKQKFVKSITYDNGPENASHETINQSLKIKSYFCLAYHSWEKGSVEQVNGLIRRYIPKKTDMTDISNDRILEIENLLNNRPRKCLNYRTPYEVYRSKGGALLS